MQIVPLDPGSPDSAAVTRLWADCDLTRPWNDPDADLARAVDGASSTVLVARTEGADGTGSAADTASGHPGDLVGTVMAGHDGHRGWVYYLAVAPGHRGTGLGTALLRAAEDWLDRQGVPKVMLMVRAENAGTLAFYERLGYADQGVSVLGRFLDPGLQRLREGAEQA